MTEQNDIRFVVDHMLVKLGKYLRILGYDAEWDTTVRTHELITRSNIDRRVFITRNTKICDQYPQPARIVRVVSTDPPEQLREVVNALQLDPGQAVFSKCIRCNVALAPATKADVEESVHPNVTGRYKDFYKCPECDTVFWKGSHVRNTCRKLGIDDMSELPA